MLTTLISVETVTGFDVINVSKYLNLTDSTNVGSVTRIVTKSDNVSKANQGLRSIFLIICYSRLFFI